LRTVVFVNNNVDMLTMDVFVSSNLI